MIDGAIKTGFVGILQSYLNGQGKHSVWFGEVASEPLKHFLGCAGSEHSNPTAHSLWCVSPVSEQFVPMEHCSQFTALRFSLKVPARHACEFPGSAHWYPFLQSFSLKIINCSDYWHLTLVMNLELSLPDIDLLHYNLFLWCIVERSHYCNNFQVNKLYKRFLTPLDIDHQDRFLAW